MATRSGVQMMSKGALSNGKVRISLTAMATGDSEAKQAETNASMIRTAAHATTKTAGGATRTNHEVLPISNAMTGVAERISHGGSVRTIFAGEMKTGAASGHSASDTSNNKGV